MRVVLFATSIGSSNGYSAVAYDILKYLSSKSDIELTHYAFQNFLRNPAHEKARELPSNIQVYDAFANEKNKQMGFGFEEVTEFITMNKPDLCIIYNDMVVVTNIISQLNKVENKKFKIAVYLDQVYLCQKKEHVNILNEHADFVICFSKYWEQCIKDQGLIKPTGVLEHGFNSQINYPIPKRLARIFFNLKQDDFIIINANRNQPRKRLDIMMMAFAEFISHHIEEPIKLLISTAPTGAWNLIEIYERELKLRGITMEDGMKHIVFIDNPQALTDEDMTILYNTSDIGINTAMGEGWGLCNFISGAMGIPQIVPNLGGFKDFFDTDSAIMVKPKIKLYTDMTIDGCPGCSEICDAMDFADAMETYYADEELRKKHSINARTKILNNYKWSDLGAKIYKYITQILNVEEKNNNITSNKISLEQVNLLSEKLKNKNINIDNIHKQNDIKSRLQAKLAAKKNKDNLNLNNLNKEQLLEYQSKIDKLLNKV